MRRRAAPGAARSPRRHGCVSWRSPWRRSRPTTVSTEWSSRPRRVPMRHPLTQPGTRQSASRAVPAAPPRPPRSMRWPAYEWMPSTQPASPDPPWQPRISPQWSSPTWTSRRSSSQLPPWRRPTSQVSSRATSPLRASPRVAGHGQARRPEYLPRIPLVRTPPCRCLRQLRRRVRSAKRKSPRQPTNVLRPSARPRRSRAEE